jgi:hypothetical protein
MAASIETSGDDHSVAAWIWHHLVPKSGQAETVQGELLRAVEKLRWEAQTNGNINWDDGFVILSDYIENTLLTDSALAQEQRTALSADLKRLRDYGDPYVEDDLYDRITACIVKFARAQPTTLARANNPALRR